MLFFTSNISAAYLEKMEKVRTALQNCGYISRMGTEGRRTAGYRKTDREGKEITETEKPEGYAVLPYVRGSGAFSRSTRSASTTKQDIHYDKN